MADIQRRPSRAVRQRRGERLAFAGVGGATVTVVTLIIAILPIGIVGLGTPIVAALFTALCWVLFRRTVR